MRAHEGGTATPAATPGTVPALLAGCLLLVELLAAIQTFVTGTITPLLAEELGARQLYGVLAAASMVPMFLTLPLGVALLTRFSAARLLLWLTPGVVVGGVVSAVAPTVEVYLLGRVLAALSAGALASVSLSALVTGLPERWRRSVLAGYAATWVIAALVGPLYAGWVSEAFGWRWALVGYLPLLLAVRVVIARQLARAPRPDEERRRVPWLESVVLASGVAAVTVGALMQPWALAVAGLGVLAVAWASARLLPAGTLTARPGRRAGLAVIGVLSLVYFGGYSIVGVLAHDVLGRSGGDVALALGVGALTWSLMGIVCGRRPARLAHGLTRRIRGSAALLAVGSAILAVSLPLGSWPVLLLGWAIVGLGMGAGYLDSLDLVLTPPDRDDGIAPSEAPGAAVLVETVVTALVSTACSTVVAVALADGPTPDRAAGAAAGAVVFAVLALAALAQAALAPRMRPVG